MQAYIGLGSNLDNPEWQLERALRALGDIPDTRLAARSSFYRSAPLGPGDQPEFINAVALLETSLPARQLLGSLQSIENNQGRIRDGQKWGPRTLDLDLLLYGAELIDDAELTVPHREIRHRNFVLLPLLELAPELEIPGLGKADELLEAVGRAGISRLEFLANAS